jgi:paraquat-inducible protein B
MNDNSSASHPLPLPTTSHWYGPSLVWLVPLVAVVVGIVLIVRSAMATGPLVNIDFQSADGMRAGQTEVRFKEVAVGKVEAVTLSEDHKQVRVAVRLNPSAAHLAVEDTQFWVVKPRIDIGGVSGLETLFSGAYIGVDAGASLESRKVFSGLQTPPSFLRGEPGRGFVLRTLDLGSLDVGSPILYRRTRVGRVVGYQLDPDTDELLVRMFIESPFESLVNSQTRFWNASGVDLAVNANGLTLNTQTLGTVLAGGVAFERPGEYQNLPAAPDSMRFTLFANRKEALAPPDGSALKVRMVFDQSVRGLSVGAPIDFMGIDIGTVTGVHPHFDAKRRRYPVEVTAEVFPLRLGALHGGASSSKPDDPVQAHKLIQNLVENGVQAQARTGNLLTGQLYIALDFLQPKPRIPKFDTTAAVPTLPTAPGTLSEIQPQLAQIVDKINKLPLGDIGRNLNRTLVQASGTLGQTQSTLTQLAPEAQRTLTEVQRTLQSAQTSMGNLDRQVLAPQSPLQRGAEQTMQDLQRAAQSLKTLTDLLERHPESLVRGKPADPPLK